MKYRIPSINILLVGMLVMMLGFSTCMFKMKMLVANRVGLFLVVGLIIAIGALARMGGDHRAKRLAEEKRQKELAAKRKPTRQIGRKEK
ncbi:MAG: hypothetical protein HN350_06330 [Phycisphaerales bacterium]|jgi:hypothetical protein|nr:hypothetical protein [Phycisphaerales bacterium]